MGFWNRGGRPKTQDSDLFARATAAYEAGDLNKALTLLSEEATVNPGNVAAHLLTGQCFVKGGRFASALQVYSALVMHEEIRAGAALPTSQVDALMVDALLAWAAQIEVAGFPAKELQMFGKIATFYSGTPFPGQRAVEILGLDEGLQRKHHVTSVFADLIRKHP